LVAGRYRVTRLLGQGGMGIVHAAHDVLSGQALAIKRTLPDASSEIIELFRREFHTLHGLRHPNIIDVYDYGRDGERWFYTMQLLEGGDLSQAAPLPWRQVCGYLRQIAALLGMLHARRLLHRDISPRNIWILPDGRLKLIDFGALSAFGAPTDVVGTPALLAPEWLLGRSAGVHVDQRADLYGLGALGYWLLTGMHARNVLATTDAMQSAARQPPPPSSLNPHAGIPTELDGLILALLRHDAAARPENTEHVIDRIEAIAGPASEPTDHAAASFLRSKSFVGRRWELQRIERALRSASPEARAFVVQGAPGMGRSRLLEELAVVGSLVGSVSVLVRPSRPVRALGLANVLALRLLDRMPEQALAAAAPVASVLGLLSPELQARLGLSRAQLAPSRRDELQQVLTDWVCALAAPRGLLFLVDDLEDSDIETVAWLGLLARMCAGRRIVLVVALCDDPIGRSVLPLQLVFQAAERLQLPPLSAAEVEQLLHSVFGPAEYLGRTAQAIYDASQGNPAHCLELLEHLFEQQLARYRQGGWTLPGVLSDAELPDRRNATHLARVQGLSASARCLAEALGISEVRLTRDECRAVSELSERETAEALVELVVRGVLVEDARGYAFVHEDVRQHAAAALSAERATRAHARLGASLLATASDPLEAMRAGLHLFRAGERLRGEQLTAAAVSHIVNGHADRLQSAIPLMEAAVRLFRAAGRRDEILAGPLAVLANASGYVDHRLAARYGTAALAALERVLHLQRARRLRRYIGERPALLIALASAALARRGAFRDDLHMFLRAAAVLNAVATATADEATSTHCLRAMEPFAALGPDVAPGFVRVRMQATAAIATEAHGKALAGLRDFVQLVESPMRIRGLPEKTRRELATAALFPVGIMECWRMNEAALELAERLEAYGPMGAMNADHLRSVYHSLRGERGLAAEYQQRFEARAMRAGAPWQVVTLVPMDAQFTALWTHDALLGKRAAAELERISRDIPTLRHEARHARATYLVLCGRYREVIETMRQSDAPPHLIGWSRGQGILARAHNRLGEHTQARELCQAALAGRSADDLSFVVLNLHLQLELALADAALGDLGSARERVRGLLAQHAERVGPLALGAIHEARARVALFEREYDVARLHCTAMRRAYEPTQSPTLSELTDQLADQIARAECSKREPERAAVALLGDDAHLVTRVRLFREQSERGWADRARRGLRVALELTGAQSGFVISPVGCDDVLYAEECEPDAEVVSWAKAIRRGETEGPAPSRAELGCRGELRRNQICYCMFPLGPALDAGDRSAVLVLGFEENRSRPPDRRVLAIVTGALEETLG
jgi:hypothetical protein